MFKRTILRISIFLITALSMATPKPYLIHITFDNNTNTEVSFKYGAGSKFIEETLAPKAIMSSSVHHKNYHFYLTVKDITIGNVPYPHSFSIPANKPFHAATILISESSTDPNNKYTIKLIN